MYKSSVVKKIRNLKFSCLTLSATKSKAKTKKKYLFTQFKPFFELFFGERRKVIKHGHDMLLDLKINGWNTHFITLMLFDLAYQND